MPAYPVPVEIKGCATVKYPDGKGAGDYVGVSPRDAEARAKPPYLGCARMVDCTVGLDGPAPRQAELAA